MPDPRLAGAVLIAARQTRYEKKPTASPLEQLIEVISGLVLDAGLRREDVDGLAVSSFQLAPDNVVTVAEQLGIELNWAWQGAHGGASGVASVIAAAEAITIGRASVVVCAAADAFDVASHMTLMERFNSSMREFLAPYGFGGTNGLFALVERLHRTEYGTPKEALGRIALTQRAHAQLNSNALLRSPLALEDYLNARLIADPLRLYDCVLPCSGADAVLVVARDIASRIECRPLEILAGEQRHNAGSDQIIPLRTGAAEYAGQLYENAGVGPKDLSFVQLYDDYPIMVAIQLEDLGIAERGRVGEFLLTTDLSVSGELPLNTGGGQLSCGQAGASGGMIGMVEAVLQGSRQAGARQVENPRFGLVNGFGMVGYGRGLSSAAVILRSGG